MNLLQRTAQLTIPLLLGALLVVGIAEGQTGDPHRTYPRRGKKTVVDPFAPVVPTERNPDRGVYDGYGRDTRGAIRLLRATELRQEQSASGEVAYLEGDVKLIQDSLTIWCDRAHHRKARRVLELFGDVVMIDPEKTLKADHVVYYEASRRSVAKGNVEVIRDSVILSSSQGQYDETASTATFDQNMRLYDLRRDVELTGVVGTYDMKEELGRVPIDPVLISYDSTGGEEARITGLYMEYNAARGMAIVRDSVTIAWHDVRGRSDRLEYYPDLSKALMVGSPLVLRERDEAVGDSIWLYITDGAIDSVMIIGQALALTPSDSTQTSPRSTLEGERIVMDFDNGKVIRMQSDGQAVGVYHIFEHGVDKGSNRVSGDRVTLWMGEEGLKDVNVLGGSQGRFLPPHLAKDLRRGK